MLIGSNMAFMASAAPKVLTFQTSAVNSANLTTYTFSAQAIGTAAADRYVIVGISYGNNSATVSSVTIGGVSATSIVVAAGTAGGWGTIGAAIFIANVPTGTTADVVVTLSAGQNRCGIGVWSATGMSGTTASATNSSSASPGSASITIPTGGFGIAVASIAENSAPLVSWTNATERYDSDVEAGSFVQSGADTSSSGSVTITATYSAASGPILVMAAW